jgi:predicted RND superfamily exporter protein
MDGNAGLRPRIDAAFERWARLVCRHRWATLACTLLFALVPVSQLPGLEMRASVQDFLHPGDPIRVLFEEFRRQFGSDESLMIAIETADVFDPAFLETLREIHHGFERQVPHVARITSLINARWTRESDGELVVGGLLEDWPDSAAAFATVRRRIYANPLYIDTLISRDATLATLIVQPEAFTSEWSEETALAGFGEMDSEAAEPPPSLSEREEAAMMAGIREVLARHEAPGLRFHIAGASALSELHRTVMLTDLSRFMALSAVGILGVLYLLFRNPWAVVLPFVVVAISLAASIGCMPLMGFAMMPTIHFMPSFLFCVGLCDSVHVLVLFFQHRRGGASRDEAVVFALRHSGLAILLTSLTTAGGLVAFADAELVPVAFLGVLAPLGVMIAFVFTVTLLPALLSLLPVGKAPHSPISADDAVLGRALLRIGDFGTRRPRAVVLGTAALAAVALLGATKIRFGHDPLGWFPEEEPLRQATLLLDRKLDGVMSVEILVDAGADDALHEPELLRRLDAIAAGAAGLRHAGLRVGKTVSIVDVVKEIHRALNEDRPEFHTVPRTREAVAQELVLFESAGSDDLGNFSDFSFRTARLNMRVPWVDASLYPDFLRRLEELVRENLGDLEFGVTGASALEGRVIGAIISSTARSYAIAFLVITPMMIVYLGSLRRGVLCMLPNLVPILFVLGVMGWTGIAVDGASLFVGAIILGLSVDDTIHFMHKFGQYHAATGSVGQAVRETLRTTGMALLFTTLVLATGFFTFTSAYTTNMANFGALTGFAVVTALLADVLLAPALMTLALKRSSQ